MKNENIENYEKGKIYIPKKYNNKEYKYILDNNNIIIITNENCETQYNNIYCETYIYNEKNNIIVETNKRSISNINNVIKYEDITSEMINNSYIKERYVNINAMYLLVILVAITLATFLLKERSRY